jgi:hypothetical protein
LSPVLNRLLKTTMNRFFSGNLTPQLQAGSAPASLSTAHAQHAMVKTMMTSPADRAAFRLLPT